MMIDATLQIETEILGMILADGSVLREIPALQPGHFQSNAHRKIFGAIKGIGEVASGPIPISLIAEKLRNGVMR